jgi:hypothetical protein
MQLASVIANSQRLSVCYGWQIKVGRPFAVATPSAGVCGVVIVSAFRFCPPRSCVLASPDGSRTRPFPITYSTPLFSSGTRSGIGGRSYSTVAAVLT